jgi:hypothetical protein
MGDTRVTLEPCAFLGEGIQVVLLFDVESRVLEMLLGHRNQEPWVYGVKVMNKRKFITN